MTINLLPSYELHEYFDKNIAARNVMIAVAVPLILMLCIYFPIIASRHAQAEKLKKLEEKYHTYVSIENEIKTIREDITVMQNRKQLMESVLPEKFYWSEKLMMLAKIIPHEAWIQRLTIGRDGLLLNGFVYTEPSLERPLEILNRFIKSLSNTKDFARDFTSISLVDMQTSIADDKQILEFNLQLSLKK